MYKILRKWWVKILNYKHVDMNLYKRKKHFDYFNSLAYPYLETTVNIDITEFLRMVKAHKLPFFLTFCYCIAKAANAVPELRQRIRDDKIIEYENCKVSYTVALEDETYCYCTIDSNMPFLEYLPYAIKAQEKAKSEASIDEDKHEVNDKFFISSLPWFSYSSLIQPVPSPADSNPRIMWGKYFMQDKKTFIPVSIMCNHALVDGVHIAKFYRSLDEQIADIIEYI